MAVPTQFDPEPAKACHTAPLGVRNGETSRSRETTEKKCDDEDGDDEMRTGGAYAEAVDPNPSSHPRFEHVPALECVRAGAPTPARPERQDDSFELAEQAEAVRPKPQHTAGWFDL